MHAGEARDHGRMVTPSGAGTSGVDDPARGKRMVTGIPCLVHYFRLGRVDPNLCAGGGVDVYVLVSDCGKWCDIYRRFSLLVVIPVRYNFGDDLIVVAVRDLCEISDQASGLVPVSAKRVRTLLRRRDRLIPFVGLSVYAHAKSVDMRDDVPVGFNPGNGLASWKPRLIERFSPERKRISWEGEILDYTGGFSPILGC
ncbi:hypothetical protein Lal_00013921 [Lupinus albus]|nr:hypothetical protein Lal_00013921 [Lupinus albus]